MVLYIVLLDERASNATKIDANKAVLLEVEVGNTAAADAFYVMVPALDAFGGWVPTLTMASFLIIVRH